jgi:hypothetical protein
MEKALIENDPMRPNEAYFRHVDYVVDKAEELVCLLACSYLGDKYLMQTRIWTSCLYKTERICLW